MQNFSCYSSFYCYFQTLENIKHIQVEKYHKADVDTKPTIELDPIRVVLQAIENGKPLLTTEKVRKGGTTYQVC